MAIGREGVGLELAQPARLGCLLVTELTATLPGVRFPVDVSGGVPRFRHRRGQLQRLQLEVPARGLERFAAPRVRGIVGTRSPDVWIAAGRGHATVCLTAPVDPEDEDLPDAPVLAFAVHALVEDADLELVVSEARGSALPAPAATLAIACVEALLGGRAKRTGSIFRVKDAAAAIARTLLPEAGARVPSAAGVRWTAIAAQGDAWLLHAVDGAIAAAPEPEALRAREAARVLVEADDALVRGDAAEARALAMEALERAPRHPEIALRVADIDARAGGRAEAALALLVELRSDPAARFGTLAGELLAETGDRDAALASLERTGEIEPAPALGARALTLAARLVRDPVEASRWLDRAVARAPREATARWARVRRRLELGRIEDALADVEHLEAATRGSRGKHRVWLRAGGAWQDAGLGGRAGALFERALRYVPEDPEALAGLGRALLREGRAARGVAVLSRALSAAESRGVPTAPYHLDLGRALADALDDLPAAVAHVAAVPSEATHAPEARGLEGAWRARLGDLAGASLAFARLRDLAASMPSGPDDPRASALADLLQQGAEMERDRLDDALGAQRHLAAALRLRPRDASLLRAYRDIGERVARGHGAPAPEEPALAFDDEAASATHRTLTDRPPPDLALAVADEDPDPAAAARADELTRRLQGDPGNDAVADELLEVLLTLGRGHELLALASARLEDATPERRAVLAPRVAEALEQLARRATERGETGDAGLFRSAIPMLTGPRP